MTSITIDYDSDLPCFVCDDLVDPMIRIVSRDLSVRWVCRACGRDITKAWVDLV